MPLLLDEQLTALEDLRGGRVIVYFGEDRAPFPKAIEDDDIPVLYECLQSMGPAPCINLVLHAFGGRVNASRKLILLLRDFAQHVCVLVPYKARSAGTLLSLGADQIVMTALAELSPIDPQIPASGDGPAGSPGLISVEDIRAFRRIAEEWFGLQTEEARRQVFSMLGERFFPTSLSTFFRADQQIRQIADELLSYQLDATDAATRQRIVHQLVSGYYAHDYAINRAEAARLGLNVHAAVGQEEALLWQIWKRCREYVGSMHPDSAEHIDAIIASTNFTALHMVRHIEYTSPPGSSLSGSGQIQRSIRMIADAHWQIV